MGGEGKINKEIPHIIHFIFSRFGLVTNTSTNGVNIRDGDMNMAYLSRKRRRKQIFFSHIHDYYDILLCFNMNMASN